MTWPGEPVIYEIGTLPWLAGLSERFGRPVTLGDVPGEVWDEIAAPGLDAVWLMGVWERSPIGLTIARAVWDVPSGYTIGDVTASPYCVRRYQADKRFGGHRGLATARAELRRRGLKLILDYVPNHVAPDHPAITAYPDWFVQGDSTEPGVWFESNGRIFAYARDPYFPPWPDVAQLNAFDPGLREATVATLTWIGEQCDGIRVDMAMLVTNEIFERTWGTWAGPAPATEFWPTILERVRTVHPELMLIAEAYWDTEWTLQQQGFDFCYDKRLYDRLLHEDASALRKHLTADRGYQERLLRFLENHDEERAATAVPAGRGRAAAIAIATLPGATLWHDGQFEGRRTRLPLHLGRRLDEPTDPELTAFHHRLLAAAARLRGGEWSLLETGGHRDILAWTWRRGTSRHVVALNFGAHRAQARIPLRWPGLSGRTWNLTDLLTGEVYPRDGDILARDGLYVDLPPWSAHLLSV
ncbi:alpha-amylase family glycosyl hydrolase [Actinoplanes couchii]|uniref:Glycosyl hydrolase family 13 catalytic domain-containing protein n=1 Tax=Actinoplanes couchii TaxID=403638 RepID=A0ABQ3X7R0_9ACTN|nr:alpha-amylase family glycosyl hydrolase [Actinoplanes couchii]MDR6322340.1 glycosidase [Actinoplanes couchii]GID54499.1 hypothetical protein Aco03nite_029030 [Actinoplanes couchii]